MCGMKVVLILLKLLKSGNLTHHLWDANNVKAQCTHVNTRIYLMHIDYWARTNRWGKLIHQPNLLRKIKVLRSPPSQSTKSSLCDQQNQIRNEAMTILIITDWINVRDSVLKDVYINKALKQRSALQNKEIKKGTCGCSLSWYIFFSSFYYLYALF